MQLEPSYSLTPNESGGGTYSSVNIDIVCKDYSGKYELPKIFLNPVLTGVSAYLTFIQLQ